MNVKEVRTKGQSHRKIKRVYCVWGKRGLTGNGKGDDSVTGGESSDDKKHTHAVLDPKHTVIYGWKEDLLNWPCRGSQPVITSSGKETEARKTHAAGAAGTVCSRINGKINIGRGLELDHALPQ